MADHLDNQSIRGVRLPDHHTSSPPGLSVDEVTHDLVPDLLQTARRPHDASHKHTESFGSDATLFGVDAPFDFEKVMLEAAKRQSASGIRTRELGVMFKDLCVVGLGSSVSYQATFGSLFNPVHAWNALKDRRNPSLRTILSGFEGVVRPGEMLLVLGNPGTGCSTFLKTLANQRGEYHSVQGDVCYDSFTPEYIAKHFRGDVVYCPEDDDHFPTLSVDDTLQFAAKMRTPQHRIDNMSRKQFIHYITTILQTTFGLLHVRKTPVGDAAIRGVSGGEKKRVSITEMLAIRALLGAWDNSTRGLDASTALEFARTLRIATHTARLSTIVSIYQAGESLYGQFDKVCVIYEGRMAYYGRADRAKQYFIDLGFEPMARQTTADFLVTVTNPDVRITRPGFENRVPRTAEEFTERFLASNASADNRADMKAYEAEFIGQGPRALAYKQSAWAERARTHNKSSSYTISIFMQIKAVVARRMQILKGSWLQEAIRIGAFLFESIIVGTVFYKTPGNTSAYFSRGGVLFFALLFATLTSMAEIPALFSQRPIVLRHFKAAMYHPFIEAIAITVVDIPITLLSMLIFCVVLYFLVGLQSTAGQFFVFFLFTSAMTWTMKTVFRAIAAAFDSPAPAQSVAGVAFLGAAFYTGYTLPKPSMIGALRWLTYINPLRYGFEGLMTNEFHTLDGACSTLVPSGPGYENVSLANQVCTIVGSLPGQAVVDGGRFLELSYGYSNQYLWRNFGIVCAFGLFFFFLFLLFTEINTSASRNTSVLLFKRGSRSPLTPTAGVKADEEKGQTEEYRPGQVNAEYAAEKASQDVPLSNDVFTWHNLQYDVPVAGGTVRRLLDNVSGYVAPGNLTALMGESGAGKTTLLNVLAQRFTTGVVAGDMFVNGQPLPVDFQAQTGYCQQTDTHLPTATVREALLFSAKLRQPPSVPLTEKEAYVETVLEMCGLEPFADAIVGSLGVEQRKRTTIGVELAANPRFLLFLDEPTSGLDARSAFAIMKFLRSLADRGLAILCTIHQPSSELFQMFDRLLLLRKGGQTVYFGDIGENASTLLRYFENHGGDLCPSEANPAEYILDVIGAGATASKAKADGWHAIWEHSKGEEQVHHELDNIVNAGRGGSSAAIQKHSEYSTSWSYQTATLLTRELQRHWRDPNYLLSKMLLNVAGGLFIGFTFYQAKDSIQGTQNKLFSIFISTVLGLPLANQIQVPFLETRAIYLVRERPSRMYSWSAFLTAQILGEIPFNIAGSSLYFLTWYWTVGFPTDRAGYTYLMLGIIYPLYYTTLSQGVAAMSPNIEISALLFSFFFSFAFIMNGVLQPFEHLGWWKWMYRVSPLTYFLEGVFGQAAGHSEVNCAAVEFVAIEPPSGNTCAQYLSQFMTTAGGYLTNPDADAHCQYCSVRTTDQFMEASFNIFSSHHWRDFGLMWVYIAVNITIIYAMTYVFHIRRPGNPVNFARQIFSRRTSSI